MLSAAKKLAAPFTAILVAACATIAAGNRAGEPAPREPVSLYLTVEKDGQLIQGLKQGNFRVLEGGEPVSFRLSKPESPASIALLVEYSAGSRYYFTDIQNAIQGFMDSAPEGHWYALGTFGRELNVDVDFTKRKGKITTAFSDLSQPFWDDINTYDAVYEMLNRMGRLSGRRVLILVGSGFDTFSSYTLEDVKRKIESTNVIVYGVGAGSDLRGYYEPYLGNSARMDLLQAEAFLKMLADKSGGQAWFPRFDSAFPDVMKGIMQSIQNQYRIVYDRQPPAGDKFHKIEVRAFTVQDDQRQDFDVRVRDGWRSGPS